MGKKIIRALVFVFAFAIAGYVIVQYGIFSARDAGLVSFKLQKPDFHLTPWVYVLYVHIVTAMLALIIGPFQIFRKQSMEIYLKSMTCFSQKIQDTDNRYPVFPLLV
jgi:predicted membrane protein